MSIKDWLQTIKDPIVRKQALYNMYLNNDFFYCYHYTNKADSLYESLQWAFMWSDSPQGYEYWDNKNKVWN
jgi:hypothetical protein